MFEERQRDRSRPRRVGPRRAPRGARRRAARGRRGADAALRAGRGHSGRGPGTVPGTWLGRTRQRRDAALGARPARAALLAPPAADVHTRARPGAARRRLGRRHGRDRRGARARLRARAGARPRAVRARRRRRGRSTTPAPRSPRTTWSRCTKRPRASWPRPARRRRRSSR